MSNRGAILIADKGKVDEVSISEDTVCRNCDRERENFLRKIKLAKRNRHTDNKNTYMMINTALGLQETLSE